jgi:general secretion pathway protein A
MYETFFGLREEPFRLTSDPRFFHLAEPHATALTTLVEAVTRRKGLILITGPCGTGKTIVVHATLHILSDRAKTRQPISTAFLFNPTLSREEFLEMTLAEFEIPCMATSKPARLAALQQRLLERHTNGGTSLLLIDEAHLLTDELLEEIRLLSNADTYKEKLLQIVLCGQPELLTLLSRPESRALRQRIACSCSLRPLVFQEFQAYVAERLHSAGFRGPTSPFPTPVLEEIFRRTEGVPRLINLFCDACLTIGCKGQKLLIDLTVVEEAASKLGRNEVYVAQRPAADIAEVDPVLAPDAADAMRSIIVNGSARPFAAEEVNLQELSRATLPAKLPALVAVECPPLNAGTNTPIAVQECEAISTPMESSSISVFLKDLNPAPLAPEQKHKEHALYLDLIAGSSGPTDPLITESKPNPVTVLSAPPRSLVGSTTENGPPLTAHNSPIPSAKKRAIALEAMNRVPVNSRGMSIQALLPSWKWGSLLWVNRFLLSISLAKWRRAHFEVLRKIGQLALPVRLLLRRWEFDFKRDWSAMIDSMALPKMKRSLLRWLRQLIRRDSWRQTKTSPLEARRDLNQQKI